MKTLETMLREERYKFQVEHVVNWVGNNKEKLAALVHFALGDDEDLARRAAWPLSAVVEKYPAMAASHLPALVNKLSQPKTHNGITRNIVRLLQFVPVPEPLQGQVMDACFRFIDNPKEKAAIKAFALTVLYHLSKAYPDIVPEIQAVIAARIDNETPAFKTRARVFFQ